MVLQNLLKRLGKRLSVQRNNSKTYNTKKIENTLTQLSSIPDHQLNISCGVCKHSSVLEVANLILVVGGDATAHDVRQRHVCKQCNTRGENTFKIIFKGG